MQRSYHKGRRYNQNKNTNERRLRTDGEVRINKAVPTNVQQKIRRKQVGKYIRKRLKTENS